MVVETVDGNEWLLDDSDPENNPYMVYDSEYEEYTGKFHDMELVQVVFNTKETEDIKDDEILKIRSIDKRFM